MCVRGEDQGGNLIPCGEGCPHLQPSPPKTLCSEGKLLAIDVPAALRRALLRDHLALVAVLLDVIALNGVHRAGNLGRGRGSPPCAALATEGQQTNRKLEDGIRRLVDALAVELDQTSRRVLRQVGDDLALSRVNCHHHVAVRPANDRLALESSVGGIGLRGCELGNLGQLKSFLSLVYIVYQRKG